jgi:hypothetical protein
MGVCKTHSFFPSCHFFLFLAFFLTQVPVNNLFSLFFFLFSRFFSRFYILMTGRKVYTMPWRWMHIYIYTRLNTFSFYLLSLSCFSLYTITFARVRMTFTGGRRFFSSFFFSQTKFTFSLFFFLFFFSLSLLFTRSLAMTPYICVCQKIKNRRNFKYRWCNYNFSIFYFELQTDQYTYMHVCVYTRLILSR